MAQESGTEDCVAEESGKKDWDAARKRACTLWVRDALVVLARSKSVASKPCWFRRKQQLHDIITQKERSAVRNEDKNTHPRRWSWSFSTLHKNRMTWGFAWSRRQCAPARVVRFSDDGTPGCAAVTVRTTIHTTNDTGHWTQTIENSQAPAVTPAARPPTHIRGATSPRPIRWSNNPCQPEPSPPSLPCLLHNR